MNLCVVADSGTGIVVSPNAIVFFTSVCVVSEALSVEKSSSVSARVDIISTGGKTVSFDVEISSFPATVDLGVVLSNKVVSLNSGSFFTDVVLETMEKLAKHRDVKLDRAVVYLSIMVSVLIIASAVVLASLSMVASGGILTSAVVDECSVLEIFPWNIDVNRVWSGLEVQLISLVNRWAPSSLIIVGPDSDALDVKTDLVEKKRNTFSPSVDVFLVYSDPVTVGESILSSAAGASVIPGIKDVCVVVSISIFVCTL